MNGDKKVFKFEVLGVYETQAESFDAAYAELEAALDAGNPIVLEGAMIQPLKIGPDRKPYRHIWSVLGAFTKIRFEQLAKQGIEGDQAASMLHLDDFRDGHTAIP